MPTPIDKPLPRVAFWVTGEKSKLWMLMQIRQDFGRATGPQAVAFGVAKIAITHNHPSGEVEPRRENISLTGQLINAGDVLGIPAVDHLIVSTRSEDVCSLQLAKPAS